MKLIASLAFVLGFAGCYTIIATDGIHYESTYVEEVVEPIFLPPPPPPPPPSPQPPLTRPPHYPIYRPVYILFDPPAVEPAQSLRNSGTIRTGADRSDAGDSSRNSSDGGRRGR